MNKSTILLSILLLAGLPVSCTKDPAYSESNLKNVNSNATLFQKGVGLPCDTTLLVKLGDVFKPSDQLVCDQSGKYFIKSDGKVGEAEIRIPSVSFDEAQIFDGSSSISTGSLAGQTVKDVYVKVTGFNESTQITINGDVPSEVVDILSADVQASAKVTIKTNSALCYLEKDFKLIFPAELQFQKGESADWYDVEVDSQGRCCVVLKQGILADSGVNFSLSVNKIVMQQGWFKDGKIAVKAPVQLVGDIYAKGSGKVPAAFSMNYNAILSGIKVQEATCKLNIKSETGEKTIDIKLPEALKNDSKIILDNPELVLHVINNPQIAMNASMEISASRQDTKYGKTLKVSVPGNTAAEYDFVINEQSCPGFTDLISFLPDKIIVSKASMVSDVNTWVKTKTATTSTINVNYNVNVPLDLRQGSYISFSQEKETDISMGGLLSAELEVAMTLTNNLPATIDGSISFIIDGSEYPVTTDKPLSIAPGSSLDIKASLNISSPVKKIESIKFKAKATVTGAKAGLNKEQSASINVKSLNFPKGITVEG